MAMRVTRLRRNLRPVVFNALPLLLALPVGLVPSAAFLATIERPRA